MFTIKSLDHLVLTVKSIPKTVSFYTKLGFKHETFKSPTNPTQARHALLFGPQKINLHESGSEFEPKAGHVTPGSGDLCFFVEEPVETLIETFKAEGLEVLEGGDAMERIGAKGRIRSFYIRDPDGSLLEFSNYA